MAAKNNSNLFFLCSLIELIGRNCYLERSKVVEKLGREDVERIYEYADVLHCEPIAKVADEYIREYEIPSGNFDNVKQCRYLVPDYWTMGQVYERLIEDISEEDKIVDTVLYCRMLSPGENFIRWPNKPSNNKKTLHEHQLLKPAGYSARVFATHHSLTTPSTSQ